MDFIPFGGPASSRQSTQTTVKTSKNGVSKDQSKPSFGSPAALPAFGSPAVTFGNPAVHNSSMFHINRTPSPNHFPPNNSGYIQKSPRHPFNYTPRHPYQNSYNDQNSVSPRNQHKNSPRKHAHQQNGYSPRTQNCVTGNVDGHNFRAPQNSPNARGMGRKSMTWTYGQVNCIL